MIQQRRRSWIPLTIFLVIIMFVLYFSLSGLFGRVRSPSGVDTGCVVMRDRGSYEDTINIVFIPENYDDTSKFISDTKRMMNSFLDTIPYNEFPERFNFFRIESFKELGCDYTDDAIVCNPSDIKKAAMECPSDYSIVLVDIGGVENFFKGLRSSAWKGTASLNTADSPLVFSHEFAHIFAGLLDEYTWEGAKILIEGPNCDKDYEECSKFKIVQGSECHVGCVDEGHSRSVDIGIMRNYWKSDRYGLYNEHIIRNVVLDNTLGGDQIGFSSIQKSMPIGEAEKVLLINYECDNDLKNCEILEIKSEVGYLTKSIKTSGSDKIFIINEDYSIGLDFVLGNTLIIEGVKDETGEMVGEYIYPDKVKDIVIIPYTGETTVKITDSNKEIMDEYHFIDKEKTLDRKYITSLSEFVVEVLKVV